MILLRSGGQGAAWGPGDFGFLDPAKLEVDGDGPCGGLTGVKLDACLLGAEGTITKCFSQRGVDMEPGQKVGIEDAIFNVRFDIYRVDHERRRRTIPPMRPRRTSSRAIMPNSGKACINNDRFPPDTVGPAAR